MTGLRRVRLAPSQWKLVDGDGVERGRYGGRAGHRWAQRTELAADGELVELELVTDDSPLSAATVYGLLVSAIVAASAAPPASR